MKRATFLLKWLAGLAACVAIAVSADAQPRNVVMYIGDGYGLAPKTAARMAMGQGQAGAIFSDDSHFRLLNADNLPFTATVTTHSINSWITDSAPGATVYAAGKKGKVHNEAVAFNMNANVPVETILEYAKKQGYAVGLVTTTRVTHATPADFASHIWNRDLEDIIAAQYISSSQAEYKAVFGAGYDSLGKHWVLPMPKRGVELDVILGGGSRHFLPKSAATTNNVVKDKAGNPIIDASGAQIKIPGKRTDELDLVEMAKTRGFKYVNSRDALMGIDLNQFTPGSSAKLLGLFQTSMMDYEQDRQLNYQWEPSLADMTQIAIEVLKRKGGSKGFFLMVEGGRIDHLEHANAGGIRAEAGKYVVQSDKETPTPDDLYVGSTTVVPNIYGSDYLIKEVLAFDYAIGLGRELADDPSRRTLIMSASDHECGGMALIGLHDEADLQANGTKVRTYAATPRQDAAMGGGSNPGPMGLTAGAKWFPQYTTYNFQGYDWPKPTGPSAQRLVIAYGSNPVVNGNGTNVGGTPGNHTPQDIWVGAQDNVGGTFASRITGRGLLDNTDLTPIMRDFLGLDGYSVWDPNLTISLVSQSPTFCRYQPLTLKLSVKNNDPYPAENVEIKLPLPANCAYVSSSTTNGAYTQYCAGSVKCEKWAIKTIAPGATADLSLTIFPLGTDDLNTTASILSWSTGTATTSSVTVKRGNCAGQSLVGNPTGKIFPQPTTGEATLAIESDVTKNATLKVFDLNGSVVSERAVEVFKGANQFPIQMGDFRSGLYFVVLADGDGWASEPVKLVKE